MWWLLEEIIAHAPDADVADDASAWRAIAVMPVQRAALLRQVARLGGVTLSAADLQWALARLAAGEEVEVVARALTGSLVSARGADAGDTRAPSLLTRRSSEIERVEVA